MANPGRAYKSRHPKKRAFLEAYAKCGNVSRAAREAGVRRPTVYDWVETDAAFAEAMEQAGEEAVEALEEEARRRAHDGVARAVYQGGRLVGHVQEYSDTLLIFLLKGLKPETYRETIRQELTGPDGGPIRSNTTVTVYIPENGRGGDPPADGTPGALPIDAG